MPKRHLILLLFGAVSWWIPGAALSQPTPRPAAGGETIKIEVVQTGRAEKGEIVLRVRIHAAGKDLDLGTVDRAPNGDTREIRAFSLEGSTLTDAYSNKTYPALSSQPRKPYFGPMSLLSKISRGGWIDMGVAFPAIPPPPPDRDGKAQPYKLLLTLPLENVQAVPLTLSP